VVDRTPTYTFLDDCIFNLMVDAEEELTVSNWMLRTISCPSHVLTAILRNLVNKGILERKQQTRKDQFFTVNPEPLGKLRDEIMMIALHRHVADGFMWSLLKLTRGCDYIATSCTTLLAKQFEKQDLLVGLNNIDKISFPELLHRAKKKYHRQKQRSNSQSFDSLFD
ncbi:hypothetical protein QZH41_010557, partial [Actinostola sp. cb2023]